jgi:hypothetical protein
MPCREPVTPAPDPSGIALKRRNAGTRGTRKMHANLRRAVDSIDMATKSYFWIIGMSSDI